ncbi:MAG: hypothetical protein MR695_04475 [Solobacterium sp.]|nr:hypothetical protein [Solobacterium sp.]
MEFVTANEIEGYKRKIEDLEREKKSLIKENEILKRKLESYEEVNKCLLIVNNQYEERMKTSINSIESLMKVIKQLTESSLS